MHSERPDTELNLALGDKLTMVNRGFVQSLCLRFPGERPAAELACADSLAETRRLMQLIREMQRRGPLGWRGNFRWPPGLRASGRAR